MNKKRWFVAGVVVFVIFFLLEYLYNTVCLKDIYAATAQFWRPLAEITKLAPYQWIGYLVGAFLFCYIYTKGYEAKPSRLGEGLRYGLIIGLFVTIPMALTCYVTMPLPVKLPFCWFLTGMVEYLAAGAAVGLIYRR